MVVVLVYKSGRLSLKELPNRRDFYEEVAVERMPQGLCERLDANVPIPTRLFKWGGEVIFPKLQQSVHLYEEVVE